MAKHELKGHWYTTKELSEMSGIAAHTLRDRLRRGYSVEEAIKPTLTHASVSEFSEASYWGDWIGMPIMSLYKIYWSWSVSHGYTPLQIQGFSRHLFQLYPNLKIVPNKTGRVIRER